MKKLTVFLLSTTMFLAGITFGFVLSPIKKGIYIGNNSGNKGRSYPSVRVDDI